MLMWGCSGSTGGRLGSVALRYRQPICAVAPPRAGRGRADRVPVPAERWPGGCLPDPAEPGRRAGAEVLDTRGPAARSEAMARLEAVLFVARSPQASRRLAELASLADGTEARTLVRRLNQLYDDQRCAFRVEEVAGGFQLMTRPMFAPWLRRLHSMPIDVRLSPPAMETLAVVAYRQPVLRADVEAIRGVQCGEILRQLIERDLVRIVGRSQELGRPLMYGTTRRFLQVFGLRHLEELPRRELMQVSRPVAAADMPTARADSEDLDQPNHSHQVEEETNVKTTSTANTQPETLRQDNAATAIDNPRNEQSDDEYAFDDYDEEEDDEDDYEEDEDDLDEDEEDEDEEDDLEEDDLEEDEDDDLEEDVWEEVEDDDEDWEDDDEDEEDDWEEEDDDWEDDQWEDEEEEEED